MKIDITQSITPTKNLIIFSDDSKKIQSFLSDEEYRYYQKKKREKNNLISIRHLDKWILLLSCNKKDKENLYLENIRKKGDEIFKILNKDKHIFVQIEAYKTESKHVYSLLEGLALASYSFTKYHSDKDKNKTYLKKISVCSQMLSEQEVFELNSLTRAVYKARDLVNEPVSYLTAEQLGKEIIDLSKQYHFNAEILNRSKIEALKMGGLLAVNKGSFDPPTFSILEWKPKNPKNKKPIVIVGKGVVFDTGGLSLKPTAGSMDEMKSDMAGAASVIATMQAVADNKLNIHLIALVPATDNRPGNKAYAPQDIITMHDGTQVEVLNTDAEGRMILADALSYAKKYDPELVIDLATLTGSAHAAIGSFGIVSMGNASSKMKKKLGDSGEKVHERLVEFPFWKEYEDMIQSDIADIKNIGGSVGGAITAGKFLEHFTKYPYIHLDIAGPAYLTSAEPYKPKGGTGVGVRLLYHFLKDY